MCERGTGHNRLVQPIPVRVCVRVRACVCVCVCVRVRVHLCARVRDVSNVHTRLKLGLAGKSFGPVLGPHELHTRIHNMKHTHTHTHTSLRNAVSFDQSELGQTRANVRRTWPTAKVCTNTTRTHTPIQTTEQDERAHRHTSLARIFFTDSESCSWYRLYIEACGHEAK